jgi:hypothetical protein
VGYISISPFFSCGAVRWVLHIYPRFRLHGYITVKHGALQGVLETTALFVDFYAGGLAFEMGDNSPTWKEKRVYLIRRGFGCLFFDRVYGSAYITTRLLFSIYTTT